MPRKVDVVGKRFGFWTVTGMADPKNGRRRVICQCDCGILRSVEPRQLTNGKSKSCGCHQRAVVSALSSQRVTHGMTGSLEYESWSKMKARCLNQKDKKFPLYGGRGIEVCDAWAGSFERFYDDMGPRPSSAHSIDRIDNDKGYEPGNCRWATAKDQARNKRNHRLVRCNGAVMPLSAACEAVGVNYQSALYRINKGLSVADSGIFPLPPAPDSEG